jgi:hypothetical protein
MKYWAIFDGWHANAGKDVGDACVTQTATTICPEAPRDRVGINGFMPLVDSLID